MSDYEDRAERALRSVGRTYGAWLEHDAMLCEAVEREIEQAVDETLMEVIKLIEVELRDFPEHAQRISKIIHSKHLES